MLKIKNIQVLIRNYYREQIYGAVHANDMKGLTQSAKYVKMMGK